MSSGCMSSSALGCVDARAPMRATYVNLYKWPESDAEFVRSVSSATSGGGGGGEQRRRHHPHPHRHQYQQHPRVVDSYSCRQMFLRSYTFSRKETVPERTRKCLGKVKVRVADAGKKVPGCVPWAGAATADSETTVGVVTGDNTVKNNNKKKKKKTKTTTTKSCRMLRKLREVSTTALCAVFHRLLSCTATVDVPSRQS